MSGALDPTTAPKFQVAAKALMGDSQLRKNVRHATNVIQKKRARVVDEMPDWQQLRESGASPADSMVEVQILNLAEKFDALVNSPGAGKTAAAQAVDKISKESASDYDSMIIDAFVKAFGQKAQAAAQ